MTNKYKSGFKIGALFLVLSLLGYFSLWLYYTYEEYANSIEDISVYNFMFDREKYINKNVNAVGYLSPVFVGYGDSLTEEPMCLFVGKEDASFSNIRACIPIAEKFNYLFEKCSYIYVSIEGPIGLFYKTANDYDVIGYTDIKKMFVLNAETLIPDVEKRQQYEKYCNIY